MSIGARPSGACGQIPWPRAIAANAASHCSAAAGEATAQLYNLARDPQETRNVFADEPARVAHFEQLLAAVKRGSGLRP